MNDDPHLILKQHDAEPKAPTSFSTQSIMKQLKRQNDLVTPFIVASSVGFIATLQFFFFLRFMANDHENPGPIVTKIAGHPLFGLELSIAGFVTLLLSLPFLAFLVSFAITLKIFRTNRGFNRSDVAQRGLNEPPIVSTPLAVDPARTRLTKNNGMHAEPPN